MHVPKDNNFTSASVNDLADNKKSTVDLSQNKDQQDQDTDQSNSDQNKKDLKEKFSLKDSKNVVVKPLDSIKQVKAKDNKEQISKTKESSEKKLKGDIDSAQKEIEQALKEDKESQDQRKEKDQKKDKEQKEKKPVDSINSDLDPDIFKQTEESSPKNQEKAEIKKSNERASKDQEVKKEQDQKQNQKDEKEIFLKPMDTAENKEENKKESKEAKKENRKELEKAKKLENQNKKQTDKEKETHKQDRQEEKKSSKITLKPVGEEKDKDKDRDQENQESKKENASKNQKSTKETEKPAELDNKPAESVNKSASQSGVIDLSSIDQLKDTESLANNVEQEMDKVAALPDQEEKAGDLHIYTMPEEYVNNREGKPKKSNAKKAPEVGGQIVVKGKGADKSKKAQPSGPKSALDSKLGAKKPELKAVFSNKRLIILISVFVVIGALAAGLYFLFLKPPTIPSAPVANLDDELLMGEEGILEPEVEESFNAEEENISAEKSEPDLETTDELTESQEATIAEEESSQAKQAQEQDSTKETESDQQIVVSAVESVLGDDLVQKIEVAYDNQGRQTNEAVLSIEREPEIDYTLITLSEYLPEDHPEYFSFIAGRAYELKLRGQEPTAMAMLSITYSEFLLEEQDLIPADLRIGFLDPEKLNQDFYASAENETPEIWEILKAEDLDDDLRSISSLLNEPKQGFYAIVPLNVNKMIDLPEMPVEPQKEPTESMPVTIKINLDTDSDLLTDLEELIYGTSPLVVDSDNDTYNDGLEVINLYSPARGKAVRLAEDQQFTRWVNSDYGYSILLPNNFTAAPIGDLNQDILIQTPEQDTISLTLQADLAGLSLIDWLMKVSPDIESKDLEKIITFNGFTALGLKRQVADTEEERLVVYYLEIPNYPYKLVVSYVAPETYTYLTTLEMIVQSLERLEGVQPPLPLTEPAAQEEQQSEQAEVLEPKPSEAEEPALEESELVPENPIEELPEEELPEESPEELPLEDELVPE